MSTWGIELTIYSSVTYHGPDFYNGKENAFNYRDGQRRTGTDHSMPSLYPYHTCTVTHRTNCEQQGRVELTLQMCARATHFDLVEETAELGFGLTRKVHAVNDVEWCRELGARW
jgi:hypothetical protein